MSKSESNFCSAFHPSKFTHTAVSIEHTHTHTHTPWTHTRRSGQTFFLRVGALLRWISVMEKESGREYCSFTQTHDI